MTLHLSPDQVAMMNDLMGDPAILSYLTVHYGWDVDTIRQEAGDWPVAVAAGRGVLVPSI